MQSARNYARLKYALILCLVGLPLASGCKPPPARWFHTRSEPEPVRGDRAARLALDQVETRIRAARSPGLRGDGRLADMALELTHELGPSRDRLDGTTLALMARARGLVNPLPQVVYVVAPRLEDATATLLERGIPWALEFESTHYGIAAVRTGELWASALVLETRPVDLAPVPVSLDKPGRVMVDAQLREDYVEPALVITQPNGTVERPDVEGSERHFRFWLPLTKGLWGVEVLGTGLRGPTVVANMAIAVAVPMPTEVPDAGEQTDDPRELARELASLIARDRELAGLDDLSLDVQLTQVALAHSSDMQSARFFGHVSPTTGGPSERVAKAGAGVWNVRENVARGYSAGEIHTLLMLSPAHRAAILSPYVNRLGIGVASEPEDRRSAFFVTELYGLSPRKFDAEDAVSSLQRRIDAMRAQRGLGQLARSEALGRAASRAVSGYFARPDSDPDTLLVAALNSVNEPAETSLLLGSMYVNVEAQALPLPGQVLDAKARFVGFGVATGSDPRTGPNGIAIAIVVTK